MKDTKRTKNKRVIVATLYNDSGTFKVMQEMAIYTHRQQVTHILKAIQDRVNMNHKFQEQSLLFLDEEKPE
jgi:hypothetical protein